MLQIVLYVGLFAGLVGSVIASWSLSLSGRLGELPAWRRRLFYVGLTANTGSLILLMLAASRLILKLGGQATDVEVVMRVSIPLTVAPVILGMFGKRVPRVLTILNALVLCYLWLDLAASSL